MSNEPTREEEKLPPQETATPEAETSDISSKPFKLPIVPIKTVWYQTKIFWGIVIAIVLAGVSTSSYALYSALTPKPVASNSTTSSSTATITKAPTPSASVEPTTIPKPAAGTIAGPATYTSSGLGVAFEIPAGWSVKDNTAEKYWTSGDHKLVVSADGFTLFFNTIPSSGLGGSGPCDRAIASFVDQGNAQLTSAHIVSYLGDGKFQLNISSSSSADDAKTDCLQYQEIIKVKETTTATDPYAVMFGTNLLGETPISTTQPGNKDLTEAITILKSLRNV